MNRLDIMFAALRERDEVDLIALAPGDTLKPAVERVKELEDAMRVNTPVIVVCGISTPEQVLDSIRVVGADCVMLGSVVSKRL